MKAPTFAHFLVSIALIICSFFATGALDITTHDTYWVIATRHILLFGAFVFLLFGLITWALHHFKRKSSSFLVWVHFILTLLFPVFLALTPSHSTSESFGDYGVSDEAEQIPSFDWNILIIVFGILFVIAQLLFVINVGRALISKQKLR
ncbi:MAG: cbb3-type cytochrome c oxidase subunit I [Flavobacteriales bacterium]|nr:cbb3-type cytochrome c oxidase subunit I [Flavobacteriales bacterium]